MLTADDAALVARYPSLPGLGLVLDPSSVAARVAAAIPSLGVVSATAGYVRFKPPTSCLVGYRFTLRNGEIDAYVRTAATTRDAKLAKAVVVARQRAGGQSSATLLDARTALLVHPSDHDLPALARLRDPDLRRHVLARALDAAPADGWQLQRLRYKPERRWVGLLTDAAGARLLLKVHRSDEHRDALQGTRAFAGTGVPVSRLVGSSDRHRITLHQWIAGASADEVLAAGGAAAHNAAGAVGALLAHVHTVPAPSPRRRTAAPGELGALSAGVAALAELHPAAGARAACIAAQLTPRITSAGEHGAAPRLLHGDYSVDQVILGQDGPVLIDVDRAAWGDPHTDLGQLLADLALRQVTGVLADDRPYASAGLDGYTGAGGTLDHPRLAAITAARLLRVASEPFRRRRDNWADELTAIVDRAAAVARDGLGS